MDQKELENPTSEQPSVKKDERKLNELIEDLRSRGLQIPNQQKKCSEYFFSAIKNEKGRSPYDTDPVRVQGFKKNGPRYISKCFDLLFGKAIIEMSRADDQFGFEFKYSPTELLELEILLRTGVFSNKHMHLENAEYKTQIVPATANSIFEAYSEIEKINKNLQKKEEISTTIDNILEK
jgi:hypothetical protein